MGVQNPTLRSCRPRWGEIMGEKRFGVEFDIVSSAMGTKISLMGSHPPTTAFTRPAGLDLVKAVGRLAL